jgi:hypothetical protein
MLDNQFQQGIRSHITIDSLEFTSSKLVVVVVHLFQSSALAV